MINEPNLICMDAKALQRALGVAKSTLERWARAGIIPPPRQIGGRRLWLVEEVQAALRTAPQAYVQIEPPAQPAPEAPLRRGRPRKRPEIASGLGQEARA